MEWGTDGAQYCKVPLIEPEAHPINNGASKENRIGNDNSPLATTRRTVTVKASTTIGILDTILQERISTER
jgi:hypothetical protein